MNRPGAITPVAVTGIGCLSAAGLGLEASLDSIFKGERNVGTPGRFTTGHPQDHPVFEVERDYFPGAATDDERPYLRTTSLAVNAAELALADGGYNALELRGLRVGAIVGTTVGATCGKVSGSSVEPCRTGGPARANSPVMRCQRPGWPVTSAGT